MSFLGQRPGASGAPGDGQKVSIAVGLFILFVRGYQKFVSPFFPPSCRYTPTCSQYAVEAVCLHGFLKGAALALWRLLRCHPFSRGGYDPVK